ISPRAGNGPSASRTEVVGGIGLGPGCPVPSVSITSVGSDTKDGLPVLHGIVGGSTAIAMSVEDGRPSLATTAEVLVAAPGTTLGRGFVASPMVSPGSFTVDDAAAIRASTIIAVQSGSGTGSLSFVPQSAGLYPVFAIVHAASSITSPPLCGGVPD